MHYSVIDSKKKAGILLTGMSRYVILPAILQKGREGDTWILWLACMKSQF